MKRKMEIDAVFVGRLPPGSKIIGEEPRRYGQDIRSDQMRKLERRAGMQSEESLYDLDRIGALAYIERYDQRIEDAGDLPFQDLEAESILGLSGFAFVESSFRNYEDHIGLARVGAQKTKGCGEMRHLKGIEGTDKNADPRVAEIIVYLPGETAQVEGPESSCRDFAVDVFE
jgi:hypothetical protein